MASNVGSKGVAATHSSVKKASMILVPSGFTASSGISIKSCRLQTEREREREARVREKYLVSFLSLPVTHKR